MSSKPYSCIPHCFTFLFFIISSPFTWGGCFLGLLIGWGWTVFFKIPIIWMILGGFTGCLLGSFIEILTYKGLNHQDLNHENLNHENLNHESKKNEAKDESSL